MQKDIKFQKKVRNYWLTMGLFVVIILLISIRTYIRSINILNNGYYSITESIIKERSRWGVNYYYTFYTKYGELRKGTYYQSMFLFEENEKFDISKRYLVAYSATKERSSVLLKDRIVPDSINLDSLREIRVTKKEWSFWDL